MRVTPAQCVRVGMSTCTSFQAHIHNLITQAQNSKLLLVRMQAPPESIIHLAHYKHEATTYTIRQMVNVQVSGQLNPPAQNTGTVE